MTMQFAAEVLKYHAALAHNRETFLLNYRKEIACWDDIAGVFAALRHRLANGRDASGKTHVSLLPFLMLAQRQTMVGFDCLVTSQAHACWPLLRPLLEAALIMGKWMDDPNNTTIWVDRQSRRNEYQRAYTGSGLRSTSLPRSEHIQKALRRLNDDYEHMNERFYFAQMQVASLPGGARLVQVPMFDADPLAHEAHVYAATHLVLVVLSAISRMLTARLGADADVEVPLTQYEALRLPRVVELAKADAGNHALLSEPGMWPL